MGTGLWPTYRIPPRSWEVGEIDPEWCDEFVIDERRANGLIVRRAATVDELMTAFTHMELGVGRCPTQLGLRGLIASWWRYPSEHRPTLTLTKRLKTAPWSQRSEGARTSIEDDAKWAYMAQFNQPMPAGTELCLGSGWDEDCWTWFKLCWVEMHEDLPLGWFPYREKPGTPIIWPREKGCYQVWLWKEQAMDGQQLSSSVTPLRGRGWSSRCESQRRWCDQMWECRAQAPGGWSGPVGQIVKLCGLHAIGVLAKGTKYDRKTLQEVSNRLYVTPSGCMTNKFVETVKGRPAMPHWHRYVVMQASRDVFRRAWPLALRGELAGIHVDAVYATEREEKAA